MEISEIVVPTQPAPFVVDANGVTINQNNIRPISGTDSHARENLRARIEWARSRLATLLDLGRREGWLKGEPIDLVTNPVIAHDEPMQRLMKLGIASRQIDLLWLLACVELDPSLSRAVQAVVSPGMQELNPQLIEALGMVDDDPLDAGELDDLVRLGLVEMTHGHHVPVFRRALRASDRVLDLARGTWALDREVQSIAKLVKPSGVAFETDAARRIEATLERGDVLTVVSGLLGSGRMTAIQTAASRSGVTLLVVSGSSLAPAPDVMHRQLRAIAREARLHGATLLLAGFESFDPELVRTELLGAIVGPIFATAREPCIWQGGRPIVNVSTSLPVESARATLWAESLPAITPEVAAECAARYAISPGVILDAAKSVIARGRSDAAVADVHEALRERLERGLVGIAKRIETKQTWTDLVLPDDQLDLIEEFVGRVRCRGQVLDTWGFGDKVGRGIGLAALFSGPPGTGKTMIAGLLANELGLDLYQIDLSKIVSKYIGETEKQLSAVFDTAETGHAILLFDEADSLFGKRSEVRSSNDRYANLETNYLLQRIESFTGITILTSNHEDSIDPAFQRRLSIHLRVPVPDESQRLGLWGAMIPRQAAVASGLDFEELARDFVMSGGYIKNAVLRAAYAAAATATSISQRHLRRAARVEYEAMGRITFNP